MQILWTKNSRFPNRIYIKFSDGLLLPLFIDDLVKLSLNSGKEVSEDELNIIINLSLSYLLRDYALRQIALSPRSEKSLSQKLKKYIDGRIYKYSIPQNNLDLKDLTDQCVTKLKSQKLIRDSEYIDFFIKKYHNKSKKEIIYLLQKEGLKIDISQLKASDIDKIKKLIQKKKINSEKLADFKYKNKIMSYLYQKGFSIDDIKNVIDGLMISS
ncbi:MAG: RecX family transcriptional regulator [Candidatus Shapirobacteria bacterium]